LQKAVLFEKLVLNKDKKIKSSFVQLYLANFKVSDDYNRMYKPVTLSRDKSCHVTFLEVTVL